MHLPDGNPPQQFNGPPPTIWLSPSHPEPPVFNRKLNIISAKSQSDEPELITPSSAYFATEDMLFRDGKPNPGLETNHHRPCNEILSEPSFANSWQTLRIEFRAIRFRLIFEDLLEVDRVEVGGTSATLVKAKDDDSVDFNG